MSRSYANNSRRSSSSKSSHLTCDELLLQPWFLTRRVQRAVNALIPPNYRQRMRDFFEDYGCMICGRNQGYFANGMCVVCNGRIRRKFFASAARRLPTILQKRVDLGLLRKATLAKRLLEDFLRESSTGPKRPSALARLQNPVDLVLGGRVR